VEVSFAGRTYACADGTSVLDALLRGGVAHPFSCKVGTCLTCMARATEGKVPARSQKGLKPTLAAQGYFLPCVCEPEGPLRMAGVEDADLFGRAVVSRKEILSSDVVRVWLRLATPLYYRAGQFLNLRRADGLQRSYSIASVPHLDEEVELHVKRMPNGRMSIWIFDELEVGQALDVSGPNGDCFYLPGKPDQPLLLIGTGTGLAPLIGVVRDALASGHSGPIHLYHGARSEAGLYLSAELAGLANGNPNLDVYSCVSDASPVLDGHREGFAPDLALADAGNLKGWRVYLCGHPAMVNAAKMAAYLAGADLADILADPFDFQELRGEPREGSETLDAW
jgi:NAD(P)H-flavin reductase/ferredoxin